MPRKAKFIFKTAIDGCIAGLLAVGVFLGRPPNQKPGTSYFYLLFVLLAVVLLMVAYFLKYGKNTQHIQ